MRMHFKEFLALYKLQKWKRMLHFETPPGPMVLKFVQTSLSRPMKFEFANCNSYDSRVQVAFPVLDSHAASLPIRINDWDFVKTGPPIPIGNHLH